MSKPSKLSRSRSRKKISQPTLGHNDSADEFSSLTSQNLGPDSQVEKVSAEHAIGRDDVTRHTPTTDCPIMDSLASFGNEEHERKKRLSDIFDDNAVPNHVPGAPQIEVFPPQPRVAVISASSASSTTSLCPLCNKQAQAGHLKSCGLKHGLTTQQVVELRRMGERHREDRRKLGVPEVAVSVAPQKINKVRVARKKTEEGAGADPDLALALALSISAASSGAGEGLEQREQSRPESEAQKMWLPQPQNPPVVLKRRGKRVVGLTALQSRSEGERERIIGDKVARVLEEEMGRKENADILRREVASERRRKGESSSQFWSLAAKLDTVNTEQLVADKLENYLQQDNCTASTSPPPPTQPSHPPPAQPYQSQSLSALSNEWIALLQSGKASDMTILCKDEVEVTCHSLVLTVRCPIMLENVVKEGSGQMFLVMDQYEHTVVKVLLQYLYGGVLNTEEISEREQLVQLRKMVVKFKMKELNLLLGDLNVEDVDEEMVEEYSSDDAADKVMCGTQGLDVLLDCLDKDSQEEDHVDGDEWEEVCEYMTQSRRSVTTEEENLKFITNKGNQMDIEEHEIRSDAVNLERVDIESEPELDLRLEESFQSDHSRKQKSVEKMREPFHVEDKISSYIQEEEVSASRNEQSYSSPVQVTPSLPVVSRSSSPDMFDMSDDGDDDHTEMVIQVPTNSPPYTQTGVKRRTPPPISPPSPSPHKRFCPDYSSDELPTPVKYSARPSNADSLSVPVNSMAQDTEIVDLTHPSPADNAVEDNPVSLGLPPTAPSPDNTSNSTSLASTVWLKARDKEKEWEKERAAELAEPTQTCIPPYQDNGADDNAIQKSKENSKFESPSSESHPKQLQVIPDGPPPSLSEAELVSLLTSLSSLLEKENTTSSMLVSGLVKLATVPVTVPALLSTGVGKVVRKLKDREGKVGRLAGRLVSRWKKIVLQYEPPPSTAVAQPDGGRIEQAADTIADRATSTDDQEHDAEDVIIIETEDNLSRSTHKEELNLLNSSQTSNVKIVASRVKTHSVLEQTGLGSPLYEQEYGDENIPPVHDSPCKDKESSEVLIQEETFDYELPIQDEFCVYEPLTQERAVDEQSCEDISPNPVQDEQCEYDVNERDNVWDDFDEGAASFDNEDDNLVPAALQPTHPTPVRSVSNPLPRSPLTLVAHIPSPAAPLTPLPDYQVMLTPHLKAELRRFGLKAVPRRKACLLLNHIYDQTHPLVPGTPVVKQLCRPDHATARQVEVDEEECDSDLSQASNCSQDMPLADMPEESIMYEQEDAEDYSQSQVPDSDNLHSQLSSFLAGRPSLLQSVLLYQPLWLGELARDIKEAGIKCKAAQLQDWLDIHCITFRTESSRNRNKAAKEQGSKEGDKQTESEEAPAKGRGKTSKRGRKIK